MLIAKEYLGAIGICLTVISSAPYLYYTLRGTIRPHAFSWFIWGVLTAIAFVAQYSENAGPGAWPTLSGSLSCFIITIAACFKGERNITRGDWISFLTALLAIPCWLVTNDPLGAILIVVVIDLLGFYPTLRKSYQKPHEELIFTHLTGGMKYVFAIAAIEHFTLATWLYPASIALGTLFLVLLLIIRRLQLAHKD